MVRPPPEARQIRRGPRRRCIGRRSVMAAELPMSWDRLLAALERWHEAGDRMAGRAALSFAEVELRLMVPSIARRTGSDERIDDVLQGFLKGLVETPLPQGIDDARRYFARALRNRFIDAATAQQRRLERPQADRLPAWEEPADTAASPLEVAVRRERSVQVRAAIGQLALADRVAIKLDDAPEWLTETELDWLAVRGGTSRQDVWLAIVAAGNVYALTRIFDPGDGDPDDKEQRRKRMERFRRRRARAREKLRELLPEGIR